MQKLELELFHHELSQHREALKRMPLIVELSDSGYNWLDKELRSIDAELDWMERAIKRQKARRAGRTFEQKLMRFVSSIVPKWSRKSNV